MATFLVDRPYIDSCLNLFATATSQQWPFSSVPKGVVWRGSTNNSVYLYRIKKYSRVDQMRLC